MSVYARDKGLRTADMALPADNRLAFSLLGKRPLTPSIVLLKRGTRAGGTIGPSSAGNYLINIPYDNRPAQYAVLQAAAVLLAGWSLLLLNPLVVKRMAGEMR